MVKRNEMAMCDGGVASGEGGEGDQRSDLRNQGLGGSGEIWDEGEGGSLASQEMITLAVLAGVERKKAKSPPSKPGVGCPENRKTQTR